jgi:hypothetical protein
MPKRLTYLLRNALLMPLILLVFMGGFGDGWIVCIESDGSFSIETTASACCGQCCESAPHECDAGGVQLRAKANDEDCIDVPLPGESILCARVQSPSLSAALAHALSADVALPGVLVRPPDPVRGGWEGRGLAHGAGAARMAHLETIIIRC